MLLLQPLRLGRETARFIDEHSNEPFFVYLSFYSVHGPIQTRQALWSKYRRKAVEAGLPESRFLFDRVMPVRQVQDCPIYAGMMESMDQAVGHVMATLKTLGLADNTVVIFTADHGEFLGERGLWFKRHFFEPAITVPLIISAPLGIHGRRVGIRFDEHLRHRGSLPIAPQALLPPPSRSFPSPTHQSILLRAPSICLLSSS